MQPISQAFTHYLRRAASLPAASMEVLSKDILSPWLLVDAFKIPVSAIDAMVADKQVVIDAQPGEPVPPAVHHDYLDAAISRLRTTNGYFYSQGLGRTHLLADFAEELTGARLGVGVDPPPAEILWFPPTDGAGRSWCRVVNGCFPVSAQMRALLPPESWVAHFQLTIPVAAWYDGARSAQGGAGSDAENAEIAAVARAAADSVTRPPSAAGGGGSGGASGGGSGGSSVSTAAVSQEMAQARPVAIILPGTGEHGFERRRHVVSYPLARLGVASIILDGPYYGARRPATQSASRLPALMDLCVLGRATIDEAVALARWAEAADADTVAALAQGRLQEVNDRASAALRQSRARAAGAEAVLHARSGAGGGGGGATSAGASGVAGGAPAGAADSGSVVAGPAAPVTDAEDAPLRPAAAPAAAAAAPVADGGSDGEGAWPLIPEHGLVDFPIDGTSTTPGDVLPGAPAASKRLHGGVTMRDLRLERDRISASIAHGAVAAASGTVGGARGPRMAAAAARQSLAGATGGRTGGGASPAAASASSSSAAAQHTPPAPPARRGFGAVVLAGTSMGGLHAAMTAACDPSLKAGVVSWVGPPSASGVFTLGALAPAVDWRAITADTRGLPQRQKGRHTVSFASSSPSSSSAVPLSPNLRGAPSTGGGDAPFGITLPEDVAAWMPAVLRDAAMRVARHGGAPQMPDRSGGAAGDAAAAVAADPRAALNTIPSMPALAGFGAGTALDAAGIGSGGGSSPFFGAHGQPAPLFADPSTQGGLSVHWQHVVDMEARLASVVPASFVTHNHQDDVLLHHRNLAPASAPLDAIACVARLLRITDITNFGPPRLPQAVAFITATHDRYVPRTHSLVAQWRSMLELWPGCTIQQVVGGHVSACLFHSDTYCGSIVAVIRRLRRELQ